MTLLYFNRYICFFLSIIFFFTINNREVVSQIMDNLSQVSIYSSISGINIYIDDKFIGQAPLEIKYPKGKYILKAYKPGYEEFVKAIDIENSEFSIDISKNLVETIELKFTRLEFENEYNQKQILKWSWFGGGVLFTLIGAIGSFFSFEPTYDINSINLRKSISLNTFFHILLVIGVVSIGTSFLYSPEKEDYYAEYLKKQEQENSYIYINNPFVFYWNILFF